MSLKLLTKSKKFLRRIRTLIGVSLKFLARSKKFLVGIGILLFFIGLATIAIWFVRDPNAMDTAHVWEPPSTQWILGTDLFGHDVFSLFVYGINMSLRIGTIAGLIATAIGVAIGAIAGYRGGTVDEVLMSITNVMLVIPGLALLIVLAAFLKVRNELLMASIIGITSWPWTARSIRSQTLSLKSREFIELSRLSGLSELKIIFQDVLPNMFSYVFMCFALQMANGVLSETGLSMIGLGPTDIISLGMMLRWALLYETVRLGKWWMFIPVTVAIAFLTTSLLLINTGMDEIFNPRMRRL
jgi:peptide/nickel transport system permease protein